MTREDKYLLGCLFAIHQLQDSGSTDFHIKVDGEWETIPWKEVCEWIKVQYAIEEQYAIEVDEK
jgi:hypothetical protein